jgi:hypothetical protein
MSREIKLDGGEITILKAVGLGGGAISGKVMPERVSDMETAELLDCLNGLISLGYVACSKVNLRTTEDLEKSMLRVNQAYARELKEAIYPSLSRQRQGRRERRR